MSMCVDGVCVQLSSGECCLDTHVCVECICFWLFRFLFWLVMVIAWDLKAEICLGYKFCYVDVFGVVL